VPEAGFKFARPLADLAPGPFHSGAVDAASESQVSASIGINDLRVGMFVHLDLAWWAHPFALSSFKITSADQIATIRGLGLDKVRWSPDKSTLDVEPSTLTGAGRPVVVADAAPADADAPIESPAQRESRERREQLSAQREAARVCTRQYNEAARAWKTAAEQVAEQPQFAREATEGLTRALLGKMMVDGEVCIRVLSEVQGDRSTAHALNVAVISMLMGRVFGFGEAEMLDLGIGALLHDVGKLELPDRVRHVDPQSNIADVNLYREHVARGVAQGKRMGLSAGALLVIGQHHEMADGSGFPLKLGVDKMTAAARIVSLVNRYDNLCDPAQAAHALTPHEALSLIFAQTKSKFDASMLNAFIRMMGVYPPGSVVQLTDDRYALVTNVNSTRPLKPRVLVYDPDVPADEALHVNLEHEAELGIRRSLRPQQLPAEALKYLSPRQRVIYFFEPAHVSPSSYGQEVAA
jgi:HD-GYP domain-containing protein (c-di-GMP phosphodiesterase class II)